MNPDNTNPTTIQPPQPDPSLTPTSSDQASLEQTPTPTSETPTSQSSPTTPPKSNKLPAIIIVVFLALILGGVLFVTFSQNKKKVSTSYTNPFGNKQAPQPTQPPVSPTYSNPFNEPSPTYANPFNSTETTVPTQTPYQNPFDGQK